MDIIHRPSNMIILFIGISFLLTFVSAKDPVCCSDITNDTCRKACYQAHAQSSSIQQMQILLAAAEECRPEMVEFWQCITNTLPVVREMKTWSGLVCCDMAVGSQCQRACTNAESKRDILKACNEEEEQALYSCVDNLEEARHCCNKASTPSCSIVCQGIHINANNNRATRDMFNLHCQTNKRVKQCINKQWQPRRRDSQEYIPCCEDGDTAVCRQTCRTVMRKGLSKDEIMDELAKACGVVLPTVPIWQCFLVERYSKNRTTPISRVDNAKLQCCSKASTSRCRQLCSQTYKNSLLNQQEFQQSCSYHQPVSKLESNMHKCFADVNEPCTLGCSGLEFCTNFNNRPTELFRSCTPEADAAARYMFNGGKQGVITIQDLVIPVKDITRCKPDMAKAIACALEIKPCSSRQSLINFCKEDCIYILTKCANTSRLAGDKTVPALCNALPSKTVPGDCVPMDTFLKESVHTKNIQEVNDPCDPNPCGVEEVCRVRRRKCKASHECKPYVCHRACPLGKMSSVLVPQGSIVRLSSLNSDISLNEDCHVACKCSSKGKLEHCKELSCLRRDMCVIGHENRKEHGDQFLVDDNPCVCHAGKLLCTRRTCQTDAYSHLYTGLPGSCPTDYSPVCGTNGKMYPNRCIARCAGVNYDQCDSQLDVCKYSVCPTGARCVPKPQVCLNELEGRRCQQFECVGEVCNVHDHDPACSTDEEEFTNLCLLYAHGATLAYRGHCQSGCSNVGVVCGHDGATYSSECAAHAARVTVDYHSMCQAFGNVTAGNLVHSPSCSRIQCPTVYPINCTGIVPPGGCCPVCAAQLTLLWDPRLMAEAAQKTDSNFITSMDVLEALSNLITVMECDVFGYVSVNGELMVMVAPVVPRPTALQVTACQSEAERLHNMINLGSPHLVSYLPLSPLLFASLEKSILAIPPPPDNSITSDYLSASVDSKNGAGGGAQGLRASPLWGLALAVIVVEILMEGRCRWSL